MHSMALGLISAGELGELTGIPALTLRLPGGSNGPNATGIFKMIFLKKKTENSVIVTFAYLQNNSHI